MLSLTTKPTNILGATTTITPPNSKTPISRSAKRKHLEEASFQNGNAYSALNGMQPLPKRQKLGNSPSSSSSTSNPKHSSHPSHSTTSSYLNNNTQSNGYRPTMLHNGKTQSNGGIASMANGGSTNHQFEASSPSTQSTAVLSSMAYPNTTQQHDWNHSLNSNPTSNSNGSTSSNGYHHPPHLQQMPTTQSAFLSYGASASTSSTSNSAASSSASSSMASTPQIVDSNSNINGKQSHSHRAKKRKHKKTNHHKDHSSSSSHKKKRLKNSKFPPIGSSNSLSSRRSKVKDSVSAQLMEQFDEDLGFPVHILTTIKQELIKDDPQHFSLFLQALSLMTMGMIKPDAFINMMSPVFGRSNKLKMLQCQLRAVLHVPLHYFHSTPLYAPFLSDLSTSDKNMNLALRQNPEQYSHVVDFNNGGTKIRMNPSSSSSPQRSSSEQSASPLRDQHNHKLPTNSHSARSERSGSSNDPLHHDSTHRSGHQLHSNSNSNSSPRSHSSSRPKSPTHKSKSAMAGSVSYRRNAHYKRNMSCSGQNGVHLRIVNDDYVSRSTGAENNPEHEHISMRNKFEMEMIEKEDIMTLWDYYVEQNGHAIQCLKRLEQRILYLYREYKKMFIIRDDYDVDNAHDEPNKSSYVDGSTGGNVHFEDSDAWTDATDRNTDSDVSMEDAHSTVSEPFMLSRRHSTGGSTTLDSNQSNTNHNSNSNHTLSTQLDFPTKSASTGNGTGTGSGTGSTFTISRNHPIRSIPENQKLSIPNKNGLQTNGSSKDGNESDGTVMTTRSDLTHGPNRKRLSLPNPRTRPIMRGGRGSSSSSSTRKRMKPRRRRYVERTETDKQYVLSRIYADVKLDDYLSPVCWSAIRRLYDEQVEAVRAAFGQNPLSTIHIVLPRLEKKQIEWESHRKAAQGVYRDVAQRNYIKALDWQPKYKRLDKTRLNGNEVWRELIAAQSVLNPEFASIIRDGRTKRSSLKEQHREQFREQYSPMDASSTIKPTRLIEEHFVPQISSHSTEQIAKVLAARAQNAKNQRNGGIKSDRKNGDHRNLVHFESVAVDNLKNTKNVKKERSRSPRETQTKSALCTNPDAVALDLRMKVYYNYGLRFDVKNNHFKSIINLPLTSHEHCWNVVVLYLHGEKCKTPSLENTIRFYCNFFFILFEVDLFHQELLPSEAFTKCEFHPDRPVDEISEENEHDYVIRFDHLDKLKMIGVATQPLAFQPLHVDLERLGDDVDVDSGVGDDALMSYHNRLSHVVLCNREMYNVLRLYIHLWQKLQKARDLSTDRWRINFDPENKAENDSLQEKNEREFYGSLMALIKNQIKESHFDEIVEQLFGVQGYELVNIRFLIKNMITCIQHMVSNGRREQNESATVWELIRLWHWYFPKWKRLAPTKVKQRVALMRRYYSDVCNLMPEGEAVVMIEYFRDSSEIGVQYLGEAKEEDLINGEAATNGFVTSNDMIRSWQTPSGYGGGDVDAPWMQFVKMPFLKRKRQILEKYRMQKKVKQHSNKKNAYKRVNTRAGSLRMTMNDKMVYSHSKRHKNKNGISSNHNNNNNNNNGMNMNGNGSNANNLDGDIGSVSDESTISKKRKRRGKRKRNALAMEEDSMSNEHNSNRSMNGQNGLNGNPHSNHMNGNGTYSHHSRREDGMRNHRGSGLGGEDGNGSGHCWFHPHSDSYFCSANLTKTSKRSKTMYRIPLSKYEKKSKRFNVWHEKRFKEIERATTLKSKNDRNNKYKMPPLQIPNNGTVASMNNNNRGQNGNGNQNHNHHLNSNPNPNPNSNPMSMTNPHGNTVPNNNQTTTKGVISNRGGSTRSNSIGVRNGGSHNNSPHSHSNSLSNVGGNVMSNQSNAVQNLLNDINGSTAGHSVNTVQHLTPQTTTNLPQLIGTSLNGNTSNAAMSNIFASTASSTTNALLQQQQQQQRSSSIVANAQQQQQPQLQYAQSTQQQFANAASSANGATSNAATIYAVATPTASGQTIQPLVGVNQQQTTQHGHNAQTPSAPQQTYYAYRPAGSTGNATQFAIATNSGQQAPTTQYMANYPQHAYGAQYYAVQNANGSYVIQQAQPTGNQTGHSYVMDNRTGSIYAAFPATSHYTGNQQQLYTQQLQTQYVTVPQQLVQAANGPMLVAHPQHSATSPQAQGNMSTPPNVNIADKGSTGDGTVNAGSMSLPVLSAASGRNGTGKDSGGKSDAK